MNIPSHIRTYYPSHKYKYAIDHEALDIHNTHQIIIRNIFRKLSHKLPCIKNKCLKYPICKHKESIECDELNKYLVYIINELKKSKLYTNINVYKIFFGNIYSKRIKTIRIIYKDKHI